MVLMIGLFYHSLQSNPRNPPIKAFIFSLLAFLALLVSGYQKERERRSRPKEEHYLMLNLLDDELNLGVILMAVLHRFHATIFITPHFVYW